MLPQITGAPIQQIQIVSEPSKTYKMTEDRIIGYADGIIALQQAIFHRIMTERYAYDIYDDDYGTELEQYIGRSYEYLEATIEKTLRDSLLQDDRIHNIIVMGIEKSSMTSALIRFEVYSNLGNFITEMQVNI